MPDDSVKFTINIEQKIDEKKLEEKIHKEVEKRTKTQRTAPSRTVTGPATPVNIEDTREMRGGIFGAADQDIIFSKKAKQIRGGLPRASGGAGGLRDTASRQAIPHERWIEKTKRLEEGAVTAGAVEKIIKNHMNNLVKGSQVLSNPQGFIGNSLLAMLGRAGPYGAAVTAAIGAVVTAPEVAKQIIKTLGQKGLPLNLDYHRNIETETEGILMSLTEQKRRELGLENFIVAQTAGYKAIDGTDVYTHMEDRDEERIARSGQSYRAWGLG